MAETFPTRYKIRYVFKCAVLTLLLDGHIMDHQVMLVFNSTGGIADTPKVSIEASVDVADLSANFTLGDGRVLQGQLEGFPASDVQCLHELVLIDCLQLISESGEMCGGFHVDVPGSAHPLSGSWYAVDPTTDKNKSKALSNLIDVLAKDGNAKLTERYFAELVEKHPEILDW